MFLLKVIIFFLLLFPFELKAKSGWQTLPSDPSVVKIENSSGTCTGTFISNNGHILTARHCLHTCLIQEKAVQETIIFPDYGWQSPKLYRQNRVATCSLKLNGQETKVQVLSSGPGFMMPTEQASLQFYDKQVYNDFLEQGFLHNGDYALLKVDTSENQSSSDSSSDDAEESSTTDSSEDSS